MTTPTDTARVPTLAEIRRGIREAIRTQGFASGKAWDSYHRIRRLAEAYEAWLVAQPDPSSAHNAVLDELRHHKDQALEKAKAVPSPYELRRLARLLGVEDE